MYCLITHKGLSWLLRASLYVGTRRVEYKRVVGDTGDYECSNGEVERSILASENCPLDFLENVCYNS
ncbi:hypothetical protein KSB_21470 [Ktedonobacter robiniae]|uniref:Integrase catalytic domain-containing protein n=1 Tax=Ktedonobacter robiniae TaxID=2778365 RepID=A0ABQ3UM33_9CHLR|nr:hypothetical protein KSB_21470 [Ktedonobacter robiniae]